ncbi:MAG: U32 family peptidase [Clostridiales bacterium]|nr:U32 family peptidase [Clostridiales bacterium]MDD6540587.1 U32 family peptidase [Bacillota bacterium]MDD7016320.1 U32 family peptidase [Bacillota bacterium]MDY4959534.1 U32 family peptidase [Lentihominibacter sp.]
MNKIELLAPAGDLEKLKIAVEYGADAVYFGGEMFSLRAGAGNLTIPEIEEGVEYAHSKGAKCHMAMNIFAHNEDIEPLRRYLESIRHIPIDAFIVSDPGVITVLKDVIPDAELHISTQANMTNYVTANFWYNMGVKRLVLARELTLGEIREIRQRIPEDMDLESFVHGAMCISYSGRCLLSNYMIDRDANRGMCAHPCRWKYKLVEEKRPGEYYPVEEDNRGTYIMNSKDLCMLEHLPDLIDAGVSSFKIEGRMKSVFYVATVVSAYRKAIDSYMADPENYSFDYSWYNEMLKASHREFTTGFYYDKPTNEDQNYQTSAYTREYSFTGKVLSYDTDSSIAVVEQRNKMNLGDTIEVFGPDIDYFEQKLTVLLDEDDNPIESAPHPQQILHIKMNKPVKPNYILRKKKGE